MAMTQTGVGVRTKDQGPPDSVMGAPRDPRGFPRGSSFAGPLSTHVALLALASAQAVSAEIVQYSDRAAWEAVTGAVTTIGIPDIPQTSFGFGGHFAPMGVTNLTMNGVALDAVQADFWGVPTGTVAFAAGPSPMSNTVQFAAPIRSVALDFRLFAGYYFYLRLGSQLVGQGFFIPTPDPTYQPEFFGLTSTTSFDRISIHTSSFGLGYGRGISFETIIPAPAAGVVALLGLAPLASTRRRR